MLADLGPTRKRIVERLNITQRQVRYTLNAGSVSPKPIGRGLALTSEQKDELEDFVYSSRFYRLMIYAKPIHRPF